MADLRETEGKTDNTIEPVAEELAPEAQPPELDAIDEWLQDLSEDFKAKVKRHQEELAAEAGEQPLNPLGQQLLKALQQDRRQPVADWLADILETVYEDDAGQRRIRLAGGAAEIGDTPKVLRLLDGDVFAPGCPEAMIELAKSRGWSRLRVTGDANFKTAVWLAAQEAGLKVANFTPSEQQKAMAQAKMEAAGGGRTIAPSAQRRRAPEARPEDAIKERFFDALHTAAKTANGAAKLKIIEIIEWLPQIDDVAPLEAAEAAFAEGDSAAALAALAQAGADPGDETVESLREQIAQEIARHGIELGGDGDDPVLKDPESGASYGASELAEILRMSQRCEDRAVLRRVRAQINDDTIGTNFKKISRLLSTALDVQGGDDSPVAPPAPDADVTAATAAFNDVAADDLDDLRESLKARALAVGERVLAQAGGAVKQVARDTPFGDRDLFLDGESRFLSEAVADVQLAIDESDDRAALERAQVALSQDGAADFSAVSDALRKTGDTGAVLPSGGAADERRATRPMGDPAGPLLPNRPRKSPAAGGTQPGNRANARRSVSRAL